MERTSRPSKLEWMNFDERELSELDKEDSCSEAQEGSILSGERVGESPLGSPNLGESDDGISPGLETARMDTVNTVFAIGQRPILPKPAGETIEERNISLYGNYMALVIWLRSVLFAIFPTNLNLRPNESPGDNLTPSDKKKFKEIACRHLPGEFLSVSINCFYHIRCINHFTWHRPLSSFVYKGDNDDNECEKLDIAIALHTSGAPRILRKQWPTKRQPVQSILYETKPLQNITIYPLIEPRPRSSRLV